MGCRRRKRKNKKPSLRIRTKPEPVKRNVSSTTRHLGQSSWAPIRKVYYIWNITDINKLIIAGHLPIYLSNSLAIFGCLPCHFSLEYLFRIQRDLKCDSDLGTLDRGIFRTQIFPNLWLEPWVLFPSLVPTELSSILVICMCEYVCDSPSLSLLHTHTHGENCVF